MSLAVRLLISEPHLPEHHIKERSPSRPVHLRVPRRLRPARFALLRSAKLSVRGGRGVSGRLESVPKPRRSPPSRGASAIDGGIARSDIIPASLRQRRSGSPGQAGAGCVGQGPGVVGGCALRVCRGHGHPWEWPRPFGFAKHNRRGRPHRAPMSGNLRGTNDLKMLKSP